MSTFHAELANEFSKLKVDMGLLKADGWWTMATSQLTKLKKKRIEICMI